MDEKTAELIAEARSAAPLYGNDWGSLLIRMAEQLATLTAKNEADRQTWLTMRYEAREKAEAKVAEQAREIATAHKMMDQDKKDYDELKERFDTQKQEIERLIKDCNSWALQKAEAGLRAEAAEARAGELAGGVTNLLSTVGNLKAELAAVEAATIERCIQIWERHAGRMPIGQITIECRALAKEPIVALSL